jgi:hypothetical protein
MVQPFVTLAEVAEARNSANRADRPTSSRWNEAVAQSHPVCTCDDRCCEVKVKVITWS